MLGSVIRLCELQGFLSNVFCRYIVDLHSKNLCPLNNNTSQLQSPLPLLLEDPTSFKGELKRLMAIHKPTHREYIWLLRGVFHKHDNTIVITQASPPPHRKPPSQRQQLARILQALLHRTRKWFSWRLISGAKRNVSRGFSPSGELI